MGDAPDATKETEWTVRLSRFFRESMPSKFFVFAKYGRLIGSKRLLAYENKDTATYPYIIACLEKLGLTDYVERMNRARFIFSRYMKKEKIEFSDFDAAFSSALKAAEGKVPEIKGFYTFFNKLSVDPAYKEKMFEEYHLPRLEKWLFRVYPKDPVFLDKFASVIDDLVAKMYSDRRIDFPTFVDERSLWATSGATDLKHQVMKGYKKTKATWGWSRKTSRILEDYDKAVENRRCDFSYIEKEEPGAVRLVVLTDTFSYLAMSYVSYCIDSSLSKIKGMYNYYNDDQKLEFWLRCRRGVSSRLWNIDVDFSGWDESMSHDLVNIVLDSMIRKFGNYDPYLCKYIVDIKTFFNNSYMLGRRIVNGLASGLRWTTFLNSIVNLALNTVAIRDMDGEGKVKELAVLGDDVHILSTQNLLNYFSLLNSYGFEVNERKSHVSRDWGEFLKMIITSEGVRGDFTRAIRSIVWSSEDEMSNDTMLMILNSRVDLWVRLLSRDVYYNVDVKVVLDDLFHAVGRRLSKRTIKEMLVTPRAYGGLGFGMNYMSDTIYYENGVRRKGLNYRGPVKPTIIPETFWLKGLRMLLSDVSNTQSTGIVSRKFHYDDRDMNKILEKLNFMMTDQVFIAKVDVPRYEPLPSNGKRRVTEFKLKVSATGLYDTLRDWELNSGDDVILKNAFRYYSKHLTKTVFNDFLKTPGLPTSNFMMLAKGEIIGPLLNSSLSKFFKCRMLQKHVTQTNFVVNSAYYETMAWKVGR